MKRPLARPFYSGWGRVPVPVLTANTVGPQPTPQRCATDAETPRSFREAAPSATQGIDNGLALAFSKRARLVAPGKEDRLTQNQAPGAEGNRPPSESQ